MASIFSKYVLFYDLIAFIAPYPHQKKVENDMIKEPTLGHNLQSPITLTNQICFSKILGMEVPHIPF